MAMVGRLALLLLVAAALLPAQAQTEGGGAPGTTGGRGRSTRETQPRPPAPVFEPVRPIFLSGRVLMSDGSEPSERVAIERVCNGSAQREAYTDAHGHFSLQLGGNRNIIQDASVGADAGSPFGNASSAGIPGLGSNRGTGSGGGISPEYRRQQELMSCELRASLPGHVSTTIRLAGRRPLDHPDVGILVLHRMAEEHGNTVSASHLQAPKEARKEYQKGVKDLEKGEQEAAEKHLRAALDAYPDYADAWFALGLVLENRQQPQAAREAYQRALQIDGNYVRPYFQLAALASAQGDWQQVAELTDKGLALNPVEFPAAYLYNSVAHYNLGHLDLAEERARRALLIDNEHRLPRLEVVLGSVLFQKLDYSGAAECFRRYLEYAPDAPDADAIRQRLQQLEQALLPRQGESAAQQEPEKP